MMDSDHIRHEIDLLTHDIATASPTAPHLFEMIEVRRILEWALNPLSFRVTPRTVIYGRFGTLPTTRIEPMDLSMRLAYGLL